MCVHVCVSMCECAALTLAHMVTFGRGHGTGAEELVTHLSWLYQGNVAGEDTTNCTSAYGAVDTIGNVEEWTLRRKPGGVRFR